MDLVNIILSELNIYLTYFLMTKDYGPAIIDHCVCLAELKPGITVSQLDCSESFFFFFFNFFSFFLN